MSKFAKEFVDKVYARIAHGDEEHRAWLRKECDVIEVELRQMLVKHDFLSNIWTDIDNEIDVSN